MMARIVDYAKTKIPESAQHEIKELAHHPVKWMKGEDLPEGHLQPWEKLLFGLNGFFGTAASGFNGQDRLFRYTFHVNPNHLTTSGVISSFWDAFNDPLVGQWMDRNPMDDNTYRWLHRINTLIVCIFNVLVLLDLGLTPLGHVVLLTAFTMFKDILGTFAGVSYTKYFAGITPYSDERGKTMVWNSVGNQCGYPIANLPNIIMGFAKDRLKFSDYRIYVYGTLIMFPLALTAGWLNTFARHRVHFNPVAEEHPEEQEKKRTLRETIYVLKYNKYLILNAIASFITVFTPSSDDLPIYRYIMPKYNIGGTEMRGEALIWFKKQFSGIPITFLYPFMGMVVNRVGGPKRMHIINSILLMACNGIKYFLDPRKFKHTLPPLVGIILMDTFFETLGPLNGYATGILNYEMLDYVEYKTGVRSEGMTAAFNALFAKMITGNINNATYNAFQ
ncbi:MAG: MFS transporter, partial [Oscillospiraceae bacterium]|nr:MFS transporter [Oscillospiraceae bacterium]